MFNFLALLGWGTGSDDELFTRQELIQRFTLEGISGGNAVFNTEKLDWFNHQHLNRLADEELLARLGDLPGHRSLGEGGGLGSWVSGDDPRMTSILALLRPRAKKLTDYPEQLRPFFEDPIEYDQDAVKKHLSTPGTKEHLLALRSSYEKTEWAAAALEETLRDVAEKRMVKAGALIHGTRIAMTGRMVSPGLFEMLVLLGRETVLRRLDKLTGRL
jgi:glutamyl/glutaminyl-tRNA synthetase